MHERERVHGDEPIALLHRLVAPVEAGVEAERLAGRLDGGIKPHVAVVVHRAEPARGDREADDARTVGETLDHLHAGVRLVERQIEQRLDAVVLGEDLLDQPAVIGRADRSLDVRLLVHAEHEHRGREHHHVVDPHGVHGAADQGHLAVGRAVRHRLAQALLMRDAPVDVLIGHAGHRVEQAGRRADPVAERLRHLTVDVVVDAVGHVRPERGLGDVGVDVDDEIILGLSVAVLGGVGEDVAGVGMDGDLRQLGDARTALAVAVAVAVAVAGGFAVTSGLSHGALPRARPAGGAARRPVGRDIRRNRGIWVARFPAPCRAVEKR